QRGDVRPAAARLLATAAGDGHGAPPPDLGALERAGDRADRRGHVYRPPPPGRRQPRPSPQACLAPACRPQPRAVPPAPPPAGRRMGSRHACPARGAGRCRDVADAVDRRDRLRSATCIFLNKRPRGAPPSLMYRIPLTAVLVAFLPLIAEGQDSDQSSCVPTARFSFPSSMMCKSPG